ncbi:MAG: hypothetical protein WBN66_06510 [Smithella sp.]
MRAKIILSLSLLVPFALLFIYVWSTATDVVVRDDIYIIKGGPIENYLNGTLTFSDLWRPSDGQRFLGFNLLMLADAKWFSLNRRAFALLIPFFTLAATLLIYRDYRRSLQPDRSLEFINTTFIILALIIFNIIQWESLIFGYALSYQSSLPFFIASFYGLELFLSRGGLKYFLLAFSSNALAILVFSGKLYITYPPALALSFLCCTLTHSGSTKNFWSRSVIIGLFLAFIAFIYMYKLNQNDYVTAQVFYAAEILNNPIQAVQFLLASFGASVIGVDVFFSCNYFSFHSMVLLGLVMVFLYMISVFLFFRSRMFEKTYLPFFLMMLTCVYLFFMLFRRFGLGIDYGMASRFTYVSILGIAAMAWIFIYVLTRSVKPNLWLSGIMYSGFTIIFTGLIITTLIVWHVQPDRKAYLAKLRDIAMRVDTATPEELSKIGLFPEQVRETLQLLREHKLNVYHETTDARE